MDLLKTPLFDQLVMHAENQPLSFHVPGHKYGQLLRDRYYKELLKLDATELSELDDLHEPEGVIFEAEQLLAQLYGVQRSYFLVNGSTVGNLAMILAAASENEIVLLQRNCHKSVLNGITLAKADPVFLSPDFEEDWGVAGGVSLETVKNAVEQYPQAKALILTYPNYYGMTTNLSEIIEYVHERGIPVLIDEAHGAHFTDGHYFPLSATNLKADIVVQSAHKTLPAMTMGAYLHFNSKLIPEERVSHFLQILQSSSPSYPIMASLDFARGYLASFTPNDYESLLQKINLFKEKLSLQEGIKVLTDKNNIVDPLKITIQSTTSLSGFDIQRIMEGDGIYTELADPYNVLFVFPLLKDEMNYPVERIFKSLCSGVKAQAYAGHRRKKITFQKQSVSKLALSQNERKLYQYETVEINKAAGEICAQYVIPYPPGIPLLFPGERIYQEDIENIKLLLETGSKFQGKECLKQGKINIYKKA